MMLVAACAGGGNQPDQGRRLVDPAPLQPINAAELAGDPSLAPAVQAITTFGYKLYQASSATGENAVLSPLSIATAFGMARAGAVGATAAEIDQVLGFPADGPHAVFNKLIRAVDTTPGALPRTAPNATRTPGQPAAPIVSIANGLFVQDGFPLKDAFTQTLGTQYAAQVRAVDFGAPSASQAIDAWVREQTAERIKKLFDHLDPATKVVLANAVYLKADWKIPFAEHPTQDAPFMRADGTTVPVPMMQQQGQLRYATGDGWQAVELPYAGDELAMWILVPTGTTTPTGLLAPATLSTVATSLRPGRVDLSIPRWDFGTSLDLVEQLTKLGMRTASGPGADFSAMADGVFLGQAVHRANITVDEWGTEAAAVTGLMFPTSGALSAEVTIRADHPFALAIIHTPTKTPLFIGHVADPTSKG